MNSLKYSASVNGIIKPWSETYLSLDDLTILRAYGAFDFLVTYQSGKPFFLKTHILRLLNSARIIGIPVRPSVQEIHCWVNELLEYENDGLEKQIRIIVTGGSIADPDNTSQIFITLDKRIYLKEDFFKSGVACATYYHARDFPESKSVNYLTYIVKLKELKSLNVAELIYHHEDKLLEGATSNIFLVKNGKVLCPKSGILEGITKGVIIEQLIRGGLTSLVKNVVEREIDLNELFTADEVFLTGSNKEVLPVVQIDSQIIGNGLVGELTLDIMKAFKIYTQTFNWDNF
jgi:branched-chain amino acid aminotransferase